MVDWKKLWRPCSGNCIWNTCFIAMGVPPSWRTPLVPVYPAETSFQCEKRPKIRTCKCPRNGLQILLHRFPVQRNLTPTSWTKCSRTANPVFVLSRSLSILDCHPRITHWSPGHNLQWQLLTLAFFVTSMCSTILFLLAIHFSYPLSEPLNRKLEVWWLIKM